jgi:predicted site-specific integrase-resolvase
MDKKTYNSRETAELLGIQLQTLANKRHQGKGPEFSKDWQGRIVYTAEAISKYLSTHGRKPAGE